MHFMAIELMLTTRCCISLFYLLPKCLSKKLFFVTQQPQSDKKLVAIMPADIGGVNSLEPLTAGAALGLPIVDADGVGRAFPELQMTLPFVYGSPPYPAALSDDKGNAVALTFADSPKRLEDFFRAKTVGMGYV